MICGTCLTIPSQMSTGMIQARLTNGKYIGRRRWRHLWRRRPSRCRYAWHPKIQAAYILNTIPPPLGMYTALSTIYLKDTKYCKHVLNNYPSSSLLTAQELAKGNILSSPPTSRSMISMRFVLHVDSCIITRQNPKCRRRLSTAR